MSIKTLARRTLAEFTEDDCTTLAQALAYSSFFSLFPLLLAATAALGFVVTDLTTRNQILSTLYEYLPASGSFVGQTLRAVEEKRGSATAISLLLLLWSGSGVFKSLMHALDRAFETPTERGVVQQTILAFELIFGVGALLVTSLLVTAVVQALASMSILGFGPYTDSIILTPIQVAISFLVSLAMFSLLYKWAPNMQMSWREVLPGAATAALLFEIAKLGFVVYAKNFMGTENVYGAIGGVIVLLTWCYFSSMILLLGAEVSSEYHKMLVDEHKAAEVPRVVPRPIGFRPTAHPTFGERVIAVASTGVATAAAFLAVIFSRRRPSGQL